MIVCAYSLKTFGTLGYAEFLGVGVGDPVPQQDQLYPPTYGTLGYAECLGVGVGEPVPQQDQLALHPGSPYLKNTEILKQ